MNTVYNVYICQPCTQQSNQCGHRYLALKAMPPQGKCVHKLMYNMYLDSINTHVIICILSYHKSYLQIRQVILDIVRSKRNKICKHVFEGIRSGKQEMY